jgi:hypothetical protein
MAKFQNYYTGGRQIDLEKHLAEFLAWLIIKQFYLDKLSTNKSGRIRAY